MSNDAGATWSAVAGQPKTYFPHKCKLSPAEKALYLSYADGSGPYDGTMGAVWRYDIAAAAWKDITPVSGSDLYFGFGGIGYEAWMKQRAELQKAAEKKRAGEAGPGKASPGKGVEKKEL